MILPPVLRRKHIQIRDELNFAYDRARDILLPFCEKHGYPFLRRAKTVESIAEKIETGRYASWSDLDDLLGMTVVIPTLLQEEEVLQFLDANFLREGIKRRGDTKKPPESFRFEATRYIGKLRPSAGASLELVHQIKIEIQIRSAFEHAWSVATHQLVYKASSVDWKRLRLAAQLKARSSRGQLQN